MNKGYVFYLAILTALAVLVACSGKLSEEEYYEVAYDFYNEGKHAEAIDNFKMLIDNYPDGQRTANAVFMVGFINANDLKNLEEAKKYYNLFLEKYPKHELASSAKYEIENLGKDINDLPIFKQIEEEAKKDNEQEEGKTKGN